MHMIKWNTIFFSDNIEIQQQQEKTIRFCFKCVVNTKANKEKKSDAKKYE